MSKITLESIGDNPDDLTQMIGWLGIWGGFYDVANVITKISCDSKNGKVYNFEFNRLCNEFDANRILDSFSLYLRNEHQGHGGAWAKQFNIRFNPVEGRNPAKEKQGGDYV